MDLKTVDEPVRVSREESAPIVELRTSRTEGIGGLSHMLWQIPLISLNPCNQIKQKTKNQTTTVSEIKWNFKKPNFESQLCHKQHALETKGQMGDLIFN